MTRHALPSLVFDMLDDPIVVAVMAADGLDKEAVLAILDRAAQRMPESTNESGTEASSRSVSANPRSTAARMALIAKTVLANASPLA